MRYNLENNFDAVVMLTWSDWHSEPRSNRYHFATRFAKKIRVFFVQIKSGIERAEVESLDRYNIVIIHITDRYGRNQSKLLSSILTEQGVRRPLLWVYNCYFEDFIRYYPAELRVYHATEHYFSTTDFLATALPLQDQLRRVLKETELLVSVSSGVAESYRDSGGYRGLSILLRNGCDFEFWKEAGAFQYMPPEGGRNTALFQGVINERLDFELLQSLVEALPEWQFWFCGENVDPPGWHELAKMPNVKDFGFVAPSEIAHLAQHSVVGLIPYKQGDLIAKSLPLKAYEYVACGLPVVTVPIADLTPRPDLFAQARTAEEFRRAIEAAASTRTDPSLIELRLAAGQVESYDRRFEELEDALIGALKTRSEKRVCGNILVLYEHHMLKRGHKFAELELFRKYSNHNVIFLNIESFNISRQTNDTNEISFFDAVIMHSSVFSFLPPDPSSGFGNALRQYIGPKLLLAQEMGDLPEIASEWIEGFGIDAILVDAPERSSHAGQLKERFPRVDFLPTRTANDRSGSPDGHADQACTHIVESGEHSFSALATGVDRYIDRRLRGRVRARLVNFNVPALASYGSHGPLEPMWTLGTPMGWSINTSRGSAGDAEICSTAFETVHEAIVQRSSVDIASQLQAMQAAMTSLQATPSLSMIAALSLRRMWRVVPLQTRLAVGHILTESESAGNPTKQGVLSRVLVRGWKLLPRKIRQILAERL
jgi:glycosyltransferase involved in cell wall biosynthesis